MSEEIANFAGDLYLTKEVFPEMAFILKQICTVEVDIDHLILETRH